MTTLIRRAWSPRTARAFVATYLAVLTLGGALLLVLQLALGERVTRVERTRTVELCSTKVACRHLLHELVATIGPRERAQIERRFANIATPTQATPRRPQATLRRSRQRTPRRPGSTPAPAPAPSPPSPPPTAAPSTTTGSAPPPSVPAPVTPTVPVPEPPALTNPSKEGPAGLPCLNLPVVERLACH